MNDEKKSLEMDSRKYGILMGLSVALVGKENSRYSRMSINEFETGVLGILEDLGFEDDEIQEFYSYVDGFKKPSEATKYRVFEALQELNLLENPYGQGFYKSDGVKEILKKLKES